MNLSNHARLQSQIGTRGQNKSDDLPEDANG
jgi:hypothetical protein